MKNQYIQFEDSGLEASVRENLEKPNGLLTRADLLKITHLDASDRGIECLEGIQHIKRLSVLDLANNQVKDLAPLQKLNKLIDLNLDNNGITDLNLLNFGVLSGLKLRSLSLSHNVSGPYSGERKRLSDISLLAKFTDIERLEMRGNSIEDISPLSSMKNLKILDLRENRILDIRPLKTFKSLQYLNLRDNHISDLSPVSQLKTLTYLNIHSNSSIESLGPLSGLTGLKTLIMRNVPVKNQIYVIQGMNDLRRLNVRNCGINDFSVIAKLMAGGALQDDEKTGIKASVNIMQNPPPVMDVDAYYLITAKWKNVSFRDPDSFPQPVGPLAPPVFSHCGGFYEEDFSLTLSTKDPNAMIFYTLDGSEPCPRNTGGSVYYYREKGPSNGFGSLAARIYKTYQYHVPILLKGGKINTDSMANIKDTTGRVYQPSYNKVHGIVIRAVTYMEGHFPSQIVTHTYFIGEGLDQFYHLPAVSIAIMEADFFAYESGIYVPGRYFHDWRLDNPEETIFDFVPANYNQRGREWERKINLEMFGPEGDQLLNQIAGIRIHGGIGRLSVKKSLRLYAREEYGNALFNTRLFPSGQKEKFKRFILRNSGNDFASTLFRDGLMQTLVQNLNIDQQAYQPAVLFINGVYWGIYNIRERLDRYYIKYKYGVDKNNLDLLEHGLGGNRSFTLIVKEGDREHYDAMKAFINENDMSSEYVFGQVKTMMDIENFADYSISQIYFANTDWPHNNIDFWRLKTDEYIPDAPYGHDGLWRWMLYDTDMGFGFNRVDGSFRHNTLKHAVNDPWDLFFLKDMLENESFRNMFISRSADYLNTIFYPARVLKLIEKIEEILRPLMPENIERWLRPLSMERWQHNIDVLRTFAKKRPHYLRSHIIDHFQLCGTVKINLKTDPQKGFFKVNTISIVSKTPGIEDPGDWTGIYFTDIPIEIKAIPSAGYRFEGWQETGYSDPVLMLTPADNMVLTAIFVPEGPDLCPQISNRIQVLREKVF